MKFLEWHFHTYFDPEDPIELQKAITIRNGLVDILQSKDRSFVAVPLHHYIPGTNEEQPRTVPHYGLNMKPIGPHPTGSFETWVPIESFAAVFDWFTTHRNGLSILVHPLSDQDELSFLSEQSSTIPSQYPQFSLGYTKNESQG